MVYKVIYIIICQLLIKRDLIQLIKKILCRKLMLFEIQFLKILCNSIEGISRLSRSLLFIFSN